MDKSSYRYKDTASVDGPTWYSYPQEGCEESRGRKCKDCIYTECLDDNVVRNKVRRWVELQLGDGEYLYCRDCGKQLYGTNSPLAAATREPAWLWVQIYTNPSKEKKLIDIVQIVVCGECKEE